MTRICVSLNEETTAGVVARMEEMAGVADLFEVRGDFILDLDLLGIIRARTRPLLFSCRPTAHGGRWENGESRRRLVLLEAVKRGYDLVDVERDSGFLDVAMEKSGSGLVVSHHDFESTPDDLDALYAEMAEMGADYVKIAVTPRSMEDVGRLLAFARRVQATGPPLIPIAMGPLGLITRVAAGRTGAPFTFAASGPGAEVAPGQIPAALMADLYRVRSVTAATKVYGVVGADVLRSLSPVIHNRAFEARGVDAVYVPLQTGAIEPFVAALPDLDLAGFSVTRPFKSTILPHLHQMDEAAALCGSANTIVVKDGQLLGSTTDGHGVILPLRKRLDVKGQEVVIVGAGGAARSAALALVRKGAKVTVLGRDASKAEELASLVGCQYAELADIESNPWHILINATPIGSRAAPDQTPVPAELHRAGTIVFDMVYDPLETRLLREAQAAGCTIIDGFEMLLAQAVAQFEIWTGHEAPLDVMKSAALFLAQEQET